MGWFQLGCEANVKVNGTVIESLDDVTPNRCCVHDHPYLRGTHSKSFDQARHERHVHHRRHGDTNCPGPIRGIERRRLEKPLLCLFKDGPHPSSEPQRPPSRNKASASGNEKRNSREFSQPSEGMTDSRLTKTEAF